MAFEDALVHSATVASTRRPENAQRIDGEIDTAEPGDGQTFACFLDLPRGREQEGQPRRGRNVRRPTLMYEEDDDAGEPLRLGSKDRVRVLAEDRTGPSPVLWEIDGSPEPIGRPGEAFGYLAALVRVDE